MAVLKKVGREPPPKAIKEIRSGANLISSEGEREARWGRNKLGGNTRSKEGPEKLFVSPRAKLADKGVLCPPRLVCFTISSALTQSGSHLGEAWPWFNH